MSVILETAADRAAEARVAERLYLHWPDQIQLLQAPLRSLLDYFVAKEGRVTTGLEIRTRKQPAEQIQQYGGLMLKLRKLKDLQQLSTLLNLPIYCIFAFEEGMGDIYMACVDNIPELEAHTPPRRRRYRDVACDNDEVIYLDWTLHLTKILDRA